MCTRIDDTGFVGESERLGYQFCWAPDSPMLYSNPWALLAALTQSTQHMRLGTGVAVPGLRTAPETANGIATVARLAPGRVFLGLGTGNTAMRTLGRKPMRIKSYGDYIRVIRGLLAGEEVSYRGEYGGHPIRFQNPRGGGIELDHPIPIHVGGFGPRAQTLAGELGDGLITGIPRGGTITEALEHVRRGAAAAGRDRPPFYTSALVNLVLLEPGEPTDSNRVVEEVGSAIMANVHYLVDVHGESGTEPPAFVQPIWEDYLAFHRTRAASHRHQELHQSHYSYLDSDEARFVTPELIKSMCIVGEANDIIEQLRALEAEGLDGLCFIPPSATARQVYTDFATRVIARM